MTGSIYDPYVRWVVWEGIRQWWKNDLGAWLQCPAPNSNAQIGGNDAQMVFGQSDRTSTLSAVACPEAWAPEVHQYCCSHVYPSDYDDVKEPRELNTQAYHGKIVNDKVVEKLLAMGGIRLAALLNTLLADPLELQMLGAVSL